MRMLLYQIQSRFHVISPITAHHLAARMKRRWPGGLFQNGGIHSPKSAPHCVMFSGKCRGCGGGVDFFIPVNVSTI